MDYNEVTLVDLSKSLLGGKEAKAAALAAKRAGEKYTAAGKRADRWWQSNKTARQLSHDNPGKWDTGRRKTAKTMGDAGIASKMANAANEEGRATMRYRNAVIASQKAAVSHKDRKRGAIVGVAGGGLGGAAAAGVAANRKYRD